jgi:hypothetical protein
MTCAVLAVAGPLDHALKLGSLVIGRRRAGLDVLGSNGPAARLAPSLGLRLLIGNGQVILCLPAGRDAQIDDGADGSERRYVSCLRSALQANAS